MHISAVYALQQLEYVSLDMFLAPCRVMVYESGQ